MWKESAESITSPWKKPILLDLLMRTYKKNQGRNNMCDKSEDNPSLSLKGHHSSCDRFFDLQWRSYSWLFSCNGFIFITFLWKTTLIKLVTLFGASSMVLKFVLLLFCTHFRLFFCIDLYIQIMFKLSLSHFCSLSHFFSQAFCVWEASWWLRWLTKSYLFKFSLFFLHCFCSAL